MYSPAEPRGWSPRLKTKGGSVMSSFRGVTLIEVDTLANVEAGVNIVVKVAVMIHLGLKSPGSSTINRLTCPG